MSAYLSRLQELRLVERRLPATVPPNLRAFVGQTGFEELCREWVSRAARRGVLGFHPDVIGSHWSRKVQADVVAVNFQEKCILIGECKWGEQAIDRQVVRDLIETKIPLVLADLPDGGAGWVVGTALFARRGFTPAARNGIRIVNGLAVDLAMLDRDLGDA